MRLLCAGVAALVLTGAAAARGPVVITERDSGKRYTVSRHAVASLRLDSGWVWSEPHVSGSAVDLSAVQYFVDPGFLEWTIRGVHAGTVRITARATAEGLPPRRFAVTLRVR